MARGDHAGAGRELCRRRIVRRGVRPEFGAINRAGAVSSCLALELIAQAGAALAGLNARTDGVPPKLGVVLGSRRLQLMTEGFRAGQVLLVWAAVFAEDDATTILDGEVTDAETKRFWRRGG